MDWSDWKAEAAFLEKNLTDDVIEEAFKDWPQEVYNIKGDEIIEKLKSRRADFQNMAKKLYSFLAKDVNVLGTEDNDLFEVKRLKDGKTQVNVYELSKKGKKKAQYYSRTFDPKETKEIRLYGFANDDVFRIDGKSKKGSMIRIIAGTGDDGIS